MKSILRHLLVLLPAATLALMSTRVSAAPPEPGGEKPKDPAFATVVDDPKLPRVLLIGDSISIGYTPAVREMLAGKANVHRIPANGESTVIGLQKLSAWLGNGHWDVIHFNWGLHDLKHQRNGKMDPKGDIWVSVPEYEKNLQELVSRLKATGAKLIWASTTPVPEGSEGREAGLEKQYNEAALRVMNANGVAVDDLNAAITPRLAEFQLPKNVHFKPAGSHFLGEKVVAAIQEQLREKALTQP